MQLTLKELCQQTIAIVSQTAGFIRTESGKVQRADIQTKSLNSLVSYVDKTAEHQLVTRLQALLPESTFLTEEETVEQTQGVWQWIIDPLDGTTNFLHQIPYFAVSVALRHYDELVIGVVYEINQSECFYAWKGGGAWLNDQLIQVSDTQVLDESLLATGFPYYDYQWMQPYLEVFRHCLQHTRGVRRCGAAAVDLAYVACGRFDAFFEYSLNSWDIAAGVLLIEEAGGQVHDFFGKKGFLENGHIVAGSPSVQEKMRNLLSAQFKNL